MSKNARSKMKTSPSKISKLYARLQKETRAAFREGCERLFASHPKLKSFGWTQYTPYYCDGEQCVFGVNTCQPFVNGVDDYGDIHESGPTEQEHAALGEEVQEFLQEFDDDTMRIVYGDHVEVTVNRDEDKVTVLDYEEHD